MKNKIAIVVWNEFIAQTANNGINFSFADLEKRIEETLNEVLRQPLVISCVCPNEIKTGTVSIDCCNICGKPDEEWCGKH